MQVHENRNAVMPELGGGGAGGPLALPIFGRSVNPIPTGEGRLSPPITAGTPNVFSPYGITEMLPQNRF